MLIVNKHFESLESFLRSKQYESDIRCQEGIKLLSTFIMCGKDILEWTFSFFIAW